LRQKLIEAVSPAANLRQRLIFPLVAKLSRPGTDHLPYDFPGYAQLPTDRFDGLALLKKRAADLCNRLHDQHPNLGFLESWKPMWTLCSGVPIGSRSPRKGGPFCMPIHTDSALTMCPSDFVCHEGNRWHRNQLGSYLPSGWR